jgi:uncharacterized protein (TIGR02118 family)
MIKLVFVLRRRAELSREDFQRYWLEEHGPLVRERAAAIGARRYVQVHTLETPLDGALREHRKGEPYDGVAELWWDSLDALTASFGDEAGLKAAGELLADEARFIDLERSAIWLAEEHEIVG